LGSCRENKKGGSWMTLIIALISGVLLIFGIVIGIQNGNTVVDFHLLKWHFENVHLILLVIESIAVGFFITIILAGVNTIKMKLQTREIIKENQNLQKEIKALKNLPFEEGEGEVIPDLAESEEEDVDEEIIEDQSDEEQEEEIIA
jgi:uncharacterized integral membrane protein